MRPTSIAIWSGIAGLGIEALAQDVEDFRHLWVLIGLAGAQVIQRESSSSHFTGIQA